MHPSAIEHALKQHNKYGASLTNPRTSEPHGKDWAVKVSPETTSFHTSPPTSADMENFSAQHADTLATHDNAHVGTHHNPETGLHEINLVGTTSNKHAAMDVGKSVGQSHVIHAGTGESVPTGHSGESPINVDPVSARLSHLAQASPPKQPFAGTHYSDSPNPLLDGNRRGQSGLGGDTSRIRLGSSSGHGKDAVPAVHVYRLGHLPEPAMASRKHAHIVRGHFALADASTHPIFQHAHHAGKVAAEASGADASTAHSLGINHAEHALKDSGYDGYFSSSIPGQVVLFGSHVAEGNDKGNNS